MRAVLWIIEPMIVKSGGAMSITVSIESLTNAQLLKM